MKLVWADECDAAAGTPPDPDLWAQRQTDQWQPEGELQTYVPDIANAFHDGAGHLVITAVRHDRGSRPFTSARLSARHAPARHLFRFGRFAARLRIPTGAGIWPAWWLLGEDDRYGWPGCGEIDIMEAPSGPDTAGQIHQGTHSPSASTGDAVSVGVTPSAGSWGDDFHLYTVDWRPGRIGFSIDDRPTGTVSREQVEAAGGRWRFDDVAMAPVLNLAVGGWAGPAGEWQRQEMLVDWVRIWA
ncbi:MAG TPA: glycoside hydrolase family 16 protein [Micromonosporaceae bacterium]